jgi:hypothetical protein
MGRLRKKWLVFLTFLMVAGAIRIGVAHYLPNDQPDDGRVYAQIARNVLEQHVYSHATEAPFEPSLIRLPGYPLFLAAIYSVFGHTNNGAVRIAQALIDTATCALVALLAFYWQPHEKRKCVTAIAALCLAALCPFTMIYSATILTEVPTMFLAVAMCVAATIGFRNTFTTEDTEKAARDHRRSKRSLLWWGSAGLLGGLAVLLRPDSGLFATAIGITLIGSGVRRFWSAPAERSGDGALEAQAEVQSGVALRLPPHSKKTLWRTFIAGALFSLAFVLVLVPWTIRNARVFQRFQPLAPAHGEMPGEFVPRGYSQWVRTWIDDERYIGPFLWSLDTEEIKLDQVPPQAFDSAEEKARVATLLERYNHPPDTDSTTESTAQPGDAGSKDEAKDQSDETDSEDESAQAREETSVEMTPEVDAGFAQLARERIAHHPFRYYVWLPIKRAGTMWFNTHSQYWPWDGELFPLDELDRDAHQQYWLPLFAALTWIYTLLGLGGAGLLWKSKPSVGEPGVGLLARRWLLLVSLLIFLRLAFFSTLENPEPRYVVEFFPFLAALGGIAIAGLGARASRPHSLRSTLK